MHSAVLLIKESYCVTFIVMYVLALSDGKNCFGNQMERPPGTAIHNPNQLSGVSEQGSPGCQNGPGCQGGQVSPAGQDSETNHIQDPPRPRNRCCPYDFDSNLCQVVNDRVLCGYNRNVGRPASNDIGNHLSGGCKLRGGRLECGYDHGPFTNARRPPGWDEVRVEEVDDEQIIVGDEAFPQPSPASQETAKQTVNLGNEEHEKMYLKLTFRPQKNMHKDSTKKYRSGTRCVEIHERVVCKKV